MYSSSSVALKAGEETGKANITFVWYDFFL